MTPCLMVGALALALGPGGGFTLEWSHSVERIAWAEEWQVTQDGLRPVSARVKGSGAGMEPGPGGRLIEGWWVWQVNAPPVKELVLAASGMTAGGWRICGKDCLTVGAEASAPVVLRPCPN